MVYYARGKLPLNTVNQRFNSVYIVAQIKTCATYKNYCNYPLTIILQYARQHANLI